MVLARRREEAAPGWGTSPTPLASGLGRHPSPAGSYTEHRSSIRHARVGLRSGWRPIQTSRIWDAWARRGKRRSSVGLDKEIPNAAGAWTARRTVKPRLILRIDGQPRVRWVPASRLGLVDLVVQIKRLIRGLEAPFRPLAAIPRLQPKPLSRLASGHQGCGVPGDSNRTTRRPRPC